MRATDRPIPRAGRRLARAFAAYIALVAFALVAFGLPIDGWSWACILGGGLLLIPMAVPSLSKPAIALFALYYASFFIPWESYRIQDLRGGRRGVRIEPWGCAFGRDGRNTELLESFLGPLKPKWRGQCIRSMLLGGWSDGNERVNIRSIIRCECLPDILDMLPTDDARRQVLRCVTDPQNLLRVHQSLLLVCLETMGYPAGYDAETWWARHKGLFVQERDAMRAVETTFGWLGQTARFAPAYVRVPGGARPIPEYAPITRQRRAADYQEHGGWGGDTAFGEAHWTCVIEVRTGERPAPRGIDNVVWWPDDERFLEGTTHTQGRSFRMEWLDEKAPTDPTDPDN